MRLQWAWTLGAVVIAAGLCGPNRSLAESCSLELKKLDSGGRFSAGNGLFQITDSQDFFLAWTSEEDQPQGAKVAIAPVVGEGEARFRQVVKKQPVKYQSKHPLRAVARLGSGEYAFVFDVKDAKTRGYDRLYFDLNHNGDLTDDKPIDGSSRQMSADFALASFPRIDLKLEAGGTKFDYAFLMRVYCNSSKQFCYASASLNAAAYREGQITIAGKKRQVALVDFNSNGRFDDEMRIDENVHSPDGELHVAPSDRLVLDPHSSTDYGYDLADAENQRAVSKLVDIDGKFYRMSVTPAGDRLTLTPVDLPTGELVGPAESFRGVVLGSEGCLVVRATSSAPARLPVGAWRVLSYRIEQTEPGKDDKKAKPEPPGAKPKPESSPSLLTSVLSALFGLPTTQGPAACSVSAQATEHCKPLEIRKGERTKAELGPPYRPVVKAFATGDGQGHLALSIVGSGGEICRDMRIGTRRPPAPEFKILDPKGEVVQRGQFSYG
jgi:hypothetical protein